MLLCTFAGKQTINSMYGTRVAVLAGDFLFAQSSWYLANLDNLEVIKLISQVIADFANGEISQAASLFDTDVTLQVSSLPAWNAYTLSSLPAWIVYTWSSACTNLSVPCCV
jgi:hypothetical protein